MRADSEPLYGLQDWSHLRWERELQRCPLATRLLLRQLALTHGDVVDKRVAARDVKARLDGALTLREWEEVLLFQNQAMNCERREGVRPRSRYPHASLLAYTVFHREFPRGIDARYTECHRFAVANSGLQTIQNEDTRALAASVYALLVGMVCAVLAYLCRLGSRDDLWTLEATVQDWGATNASNVINARTRDRGTFASLINSLCFSAAVNSSLDGLGRIDPSTSTVLIGIVLGNTWGFALDCIFGSDEGLREYLWSPVLGMRYAMGSLASWRFARYMVTIVFDMFFTVILFQKLFSLVVTHPLFTRREWIANAIVSSFISVLTFQVYANMTRFRWAYPSGREDPADPWISGATMILATVVMNMVYLTTETRTRWGEPGINDPAVKIVVTIAHFGGLALLQLCQRTDPDPADPLAHDPVAGLDVSCALKDVVATQSRAPIGLAVFLCIAIAALGYTIFATTRLPRWVGRVPAHWSLFAGYVALTLAILCGFTFVPLFRAPPGRMRAPCGGG